MNRDRSRKPPDRLNRLKAMAGLEPGDEDLLRELGEKLGERRDELWRHGQASQVDADAP